MPARPVRRRFSEDIARRLERLAWWDWPDEAIRRANGDVATNGDSKLGGKTDINGDTLVAPSPPNPCNPLNKKKAKKR